MNHTNSLKIGFLHDEILILMLISYIFTAKLNMKVNICLPF